MDKPRLPFNYSKHLQQITHPRCRVDHEPPTFPANRLAGIDQLVLDARTYMHRTKENVNLLLNIARIMRTARGHFDENKKPPLTYGELANRLKQMDMLDLQNFVLGKRVLDAQINGSGGIPEPSKLKKSKQSKDKQLSSSLVKSSSYYTSVMDKSTLEENEIFSKYIGWNLHLPQDSNELTRLMRPRIALHFGAMDGRPLGVVVVQLYTEAAPLIVLEFVRNCMLRHSHEFSMRRIFPGLWLEAYLQGCSSPLNEPLEFDTRVVDHGRQAYVLSCAKEYCLHGFPGPAINFTISLKRLKVLNGRRVGFGRVISGDKVIDCMELHGTKNGKMSKPILVTYCNVL